jgi:plasmid stabilization system protein ParE
MPRLVLLRRAVSDIEVAAGWYEDRQPGLGQRFVDELDFVLQRVAAAPLQFPRIHAQIRRGLLRRFPYAVYFLDGGGLVEVIAVLHLHRHPDTWKGRA